MMRASRTILLGAALVATLVAAVLPVDDAGVVGPVARTAPGGGAIGAATAAAVVAPVAAAPSPAGPPDAAPTTVSAGIAVPDLERLRRSPSVIEGGDPFVLPPPPPPAPPPVARARKAAAPPPAPPPQAPPLPFRMIGSFDEEGKVTVFAERQNGDVVAMRVADIVDNVYRVEAINERTMTLTYLPLGQKQTLPLGEASR